MKALRSFEISGNTHSTSVTYQKIWISNTVVRISNAATVFLFAGEQAVRYGYAGICYTLQSPSHPKHHTTLTIIHQSYLHIAYEYVLWIKTISIRIVQVIMPTSTLKLKKGWIHTCENKNTVEHRLCKIMGADPISDNSEILLDMIRCNKNNIYSETCLMLIKFMAQESVWYLQIQSAPINFSQQTDGERLRGVSRQAVMGIA
jgi:hypothetical protein